MVMHLKQRKAKIKLFHPSILKTLLNCLLFPPLQMLLKGLFYCICRARRSAGKMTTAVTALLNETEEYGDEGATMPQEDAENYPDDSVHGE